LAKEREKESGKILKEIERKNNRKRCRIKGKDIGRENNRKIKSGKC
jgi:hypothetical protein